MSLNVWAWVDPDLESEPPHSVTYVHLPCRLCHCQDHFLRQISGEWYLECDSCTSQVAIEDSLVNPYLLAAGLPISWTIAGLT